VAYRSSIIAPSLSTGGGDATIELAETYYKHTEIELHEDGGKLSLFDYFLSVSACSSTAAI
jgi:hypothetical protein